MLAYMPSVITILLALLGGMVLLWVALLATLWFTRPHELRIRDVARILPDVIRLVQRLAADPSLPGGVRIRLWALLLYLVFPLDLVPDFIPVVGYADDIIIVALVLRSVIRAAGIQALEQHWPGTPEGLAAVSRLTRLSVA